MNLPRIIPLVLIMLAGYSFSAQAIPEFARTYELSCSACHSAFPKLNAFGEHFAASNYKLPNWREKTLDLGDSRLALPDHVPLAIRAQAYIQGRSAEFIDTLSGETIDANSDFQSPYLVKLLSSAPLSEHLTYYFYGIFAEKGENGTVIIEDAWIRYDDVFCTKVGFQLGQFQVSDLMFPRELRLTFQDYMVYRMANITYERGMLLDRDFGPFSLGLGLVNGNGIEESFNINSPGYRRPDRLFDNNNSKSLFGRLGAEIGPVTVGLFGLTGKQHTATGPAGLEIGDGDSDIRVSGVDFSGEIAGKTSWFVQYLWNRWDDFLQPGPDNDFPQQSDDYDWGGGFLGIDYIPNEKWALSALYNYADAGDLDDTDTIYEGIDINTLTLTASYYFMRNAKGIIEVNFDFLDTEDQSGLYYTGHLTRENYLLLGFDVAF
ncbi:hypothetical protein SAMN04487965_0704 [Microbulbifer donghaiensis]|uniref:Cytochrome c domain-containing protein n=1 Tax=Microbulbifer donghaiensis TaxID=494016 RepID=A0A1M4WJ57_9GAMM|nr:hypothetical protein [Microbulbifer donghaiensis]SHE81246.1 hypothetical protein SAMN04487965_0704 [Microbulbifer donghaiensis]